MREIDGVKIFSLSIRFLVAVVLFMINPGLALVYVIWVGSKCARARATRPEAPMAPEQFDSFMAQQDRERQQADELIARQQAAINRYLRSPA